MEQTAIQSKVVDFSNLSYSPALLLDARLSAAITDDSEFREGCECGFEIICFAMEGAASTGIFPYSSNVVVDFVRDNLLEYGGGLVPRLAMGVGVVLGGLSAIALAQLEEAKEGLKELMRLLERL